MSSKKSSNRPSAKKRAARRKRKANLQPVDVLYRNVGQIMPDRVRVQLIYDDLNQQRASVSANFSAWGFRANSAFDPDLLLSTGGISGFAELAQFYQFYRVDAIKTQMEVVSLDSIAYTIGCCPTNTNVGASISNRALALDFLENPRSHQQLVPPSGGPVARMTYNFDLATIYGDRRQYLSDINFAAAVNANPVQIVYLYYVLFTGGTVGTLGVTVSNRLFFNVEFYHRAPLFG